MTIRSVLAIAVLVWLSVGPARGGEPLVTLDGRTLDASLVSASESGALRFQPADSTAAAIDVQLGDVYCWGAPVEPPSGPLIAGVGGSLIVAEILHADDAGLAVRSELWGERTLPLECVRGIVFRPPADLAPRDELLARMLGASGDNKPAADADLLILANGDELSGVVVGIDAGHVELDAAVGRVKVEVDRLAAVVFNPTLLAQPSRGGSRTLLGLTDGSRIVAAGFSLDGDRVSLQPASLANRDDPPWQLSRAGLRFLQPLTGTRMVYLSDLEPESYKHVPYLDTAWPYRADRSVVDTQLRAAGRPYVKGIGMHSASRLTYALDKPYRKLEARLAVDDSTLGQGSVTFRVFVDNEERYASPVVHGAMAPLPISVDVSVGRRVSLIVDFAERGDVLDRADWLDARLVE